MSRWRRSSQLLSRLGSSLQSSLGQTRSVKASTTKLPVVLLQDVEGLGAVGKETKVNHGYARNYLIPKRLATVPRSKAGAGVAVGTAASRAAQSSSLEEEAQQRKEAAQQKRQIESLIKKLTGSTLTLKRKTQPGSHVLDQELTAKDITDAIARQMRIELVPELLELEAGDTLTVVGEYRLPLKLILPSGQRAMLEVNVLST